MFLRKQLEEKGWSVEEAGTGAEALECFATKGPFDLALVDWNLEGPDGLTFVQGVRSRPDGQTVKMMMVTSQNRKEDIEKALVSGVDEYIMKPFTREILEDKLQLLGWKG